MAERKRFQPGKRVGGALYLHSSAVAEASDAVRSLIERACASADDHVWNVAKVASKSVSLLLYEDFDEAAFPALLASVRMDLDGGSVYRTDYRGRANPPILHRKETLLSQFDARRPAFTALTKVAEERGLFAEPHKIGTRSPWLARVTQAGLSIHGAKLVPVRDGAADISRHKTAIVRRELSQPIQLLVANGIISPGSSVFDYGCGQGDDVAALLANGFQAFGWDPHHAKNGLREMADAVNLGFVLNVIEDRHERVETLKAAWSFARRALCIAVMTVGKANYVGQRPYRDGYLTTRGTFQKYFAQQELRDFIQEVVGEAPVALGPGMFAIFRDKDLEQEVVFRRRSRAIIRPVGMRRPERFRVAAAARPLLSKRIGPELERLWAAMAERGRILDPDEFPEGLLSDLQSARVSATRATEFCLSELFDQSEIACAATSRREDLLVHLALTLFPGAPKYAGLPRSMQRDVRAFFGSHAASLHIARDLLFSVGKEGSAREAVDAAVTNGLGAWRNAATFRFQSAALNRLPAVLRVLVGCAGVLRGGVEAADFIDIKLDGPRVTFIACVDAVARLPLVSERTRVDLARLRTTVDNPSGMVLYLKGKFLPCDFAGREDQVRFDEKLVCAGIVSQDGRGPSYDELRETLRAYQHRAATS